MANDRTELPEGWTEDEWEMVFGTREFIPPAKPSIADLDGLTKLPARACSKRMKRLRAMKMSDVQASHRNSAYAFKLYDSQHVYERLQSVKQQKESSELQAILRKMQMKSGMVHLTAQPNHVDAILDRLERDYPHFKDATDFIRQRVRLNGLKQHPVLDFGVNILLDGPAGCGKSSFLMELSDAFGTHFISISCASASNGFDITGLSSGWGNGHAGKLHDVLVEKACPNPIVLLDELDKAGDDHERHRFMGALYGLLEKNNAKRFRDEFVDIELDASRINWFASSNNALNLDAPILDRFHVIQVRYPNRDDLQQIIPRLFQRIVTEHELGNVFSTELHQNVTLKLLEVENASIRKLKTMLEMALANAAVRAKQNILISLKPEDIPATASTEAKQKMGFIH